ncbi:MAG: glycosyltransferase family 4 protein [Bacteroidetes bacterium]|nr:glycosyltransferase family 4 protein [Bacteroidota bacterium]
MRILFISRSTLFTNTGGDTVQIIKTAEYLRTSGVSVDIRLTNEKIDYRGYDLIHFFNIIRPADILQHIIDSGKPYVVSTIFVDYSEYEKKVRRGFAKIIFSFLSADQIEYFKAIARSIKNNEKIISRKYIWWGQRKTIKYILSNAACLLPNSENEYKRLLQRYGIPQKYKVIPNAIDENVFVNTGHAQVRQDDLIICVARIEGLKNQLNLIKAMNGSRFNVCIVGAHSTNQYKYYEECKRIAHDNIKFTGPLEREELIKYYSLAKVHILPSWFETTGLSSLEAAAMGCNIVITDKGDTREYFEDMAWYCDPQSPDSISSAIEKAAASPANEELIKKIFNHYTWKIAAKKTAVAYEEIVKRSS